MKNRLIPYGYRIADGKYAIVTEEAGVVKKIYDLYCRGESYKGIAAVINKAKCPPYRLGAAWNKNMIKRILENERYIGTKDFRPIIRESQFKQARETHDQKLRKWSPAEKDESKIFWKMLRCDKCGRRMLRTGVTTQIAGALHLRCEDTACDNRSRTTTDTLLRSVNELLENVAQAARDSQAKTYTLSKDIIKINNQIIKGIQKPDDPTGTVALILNGIAARYAGFDDHRLPPALLQVVPMDADSKPDWNLLKQAVSHICISGESIRMVLTTGFEIEWKVM